MIEISDRQRLNKKYQTAFALFPGQKSMPGLQALFRQPAKTTGMSFQNYALPLMDTISLQGSHTLVNSYKNSIEMKHEISMLVSSYIFQTRVSPIEDYKDTSSWLSFC